MTQHAGDVQLRVTWGRCARGNWCPLNTVDLKNSAFGSGGVYIIWHGGTKPRVVYVGQAKKFRDRLSDHRDDGRIQRYAPYGLYVTWAVVQATSRDGVENYLARTYEPLVGERRPTAAPIKVNLPWD